MANMEFLASDELEGRDTATEGGELAALYLKSELKKYGIQMLDELGSYYQEVPLVRTTFNPKSQIILLDSENNVIDELEYLEDFTGSTRTFSAIDTTVGIVFAGYGISADEYNYNDYDSIDVSGKFVMVWPGEPVSSDTSFFEGDKDTKYASLWTKVSTAQKQGALGIFLSSKMEATYGWESIINYTSKGGLSLRTAGNTENRSTGRLPRVYLRSTTLEKILDRNDGKYNEIKETIASGLPIPHFELDQKVKVNLSFISDSSLTSDNVIGYFEGTDPVLKNEIVSIGAHYDHVGKSSAGIYNGADDNASGTVVVLEVAKAIAYNKDFRRSVLFTLHTGEERGLLGSKHLTANLDAMENIVAHINLDMVGRGPTDSIYNIGSDKLSTEFSELVKRANRESANMVFDYKYDAPDDPNRFYTRSDHYNFAKQGIPVVFFFDHMTEDYHKVTDTAEKINYEKLAKIAELSYHILKITGNRDEKPLVDKPITSK
jgi:hypothetical protein